MLTDKAISDSEDREKLMPAKEHLPFMGVGPAYVAAIVALTVAGIVLSASGIIPACAYGAAAPIAAAVGVALIIGSVALWASANFKSKLGANIANNHLITTGVYAAVRNPVYSAAMFGCTGVILLADNAWLLLLPVVFWLFMTVLMKATEEKWLTALYGDEYRSYCAKVNRCIPWPPSWWRPLLSP